jgi:hypothetical protein
MGEASSKVVLDRTQSSENREIMYVVAQPYSEWCAPIRAHNTTAPKETNRTRRSYGSQRRLEA